MTDIYPESDKHHMELQRPRPGWLREDCPKWCRANHRNDSHPVDRFHISDSFSTPLSLERFVEMTKRDDDWAPEILDAELFQPYREAEPVITFGYVYGNGFAVKLTLKEAERIAYILASLTNVARDTDEMSCIAENLADDRQWK